MYRKILGSAALAVFSLVFSLTPVVAEAVDTSKLKAMKARSIGPAGMSGRVTAIAADPQNTDVIYVGTASGGLFKSINGGITWEPLFDEQPVASIGAVGVDPSNPDMIWAGTGEGNPRNSQTVGRGLYKSLDGGRTWTLSGLEKTEHIHRVLIDPNDSEVVYVAALGTTWGENPERGVFRTRDGGASWKRVLYVDEKTGAADLVMDPRNPKKLIAAMWEHRRWPWAFKSGGPGSGIYVTFDGGENWARRTPGDGLPEGELGRVGLAISHSRPQVVYALVEAKKNALYRSNDGGLTWELVNDDNSIGNRPFYYADIFVDPSNENRIYSLHSSVTYSEDGGKSFQRMASGIHPDHHAFWVDPNDPNYLIEGNDGGLAISHDRGESWRFVRNLPLAQFYHINLDNDRPFNVYGGLQDNGSWRGPSRIWGGGGIRSSEWQDVGFGDGFDVAPDPSDPRFVYSMSQGGNLRRYDTETGEGKTIRPPDPEGELLRFNWNAALALDPFDPRTIYYGSQYLHRSRDNGNSWTTISPDLTTNDPEKQKQLDSGGLTYDVTGAENHTTMMTIAPSPVQKGVIWVGTDDGNVQVTRDDGKTWTNVVGNMPGVPPHTWVPHVEASKFDAGEAFVVFDDHRRSNWTTYVYKTADFGVTWTSLVRENLDGFAHVIEQDAVVEDLLFLGTEFHLYFSLDKGISWNQWEHGLPTVAVRDLAVHPRDGDLAIATFGRSIFIIDDIGPLREMATQGSTVLDKPLHLFPVPDAVQSISTSLPRGGVIFPGDADFSGDNRSRGALITYALQVEETDEPAGEEDESAENSSESKKPKVKLEVLDAGGNVIRTLTQEPESGLNRITWELDRKGVRLPSPFGGGSRRGEPAGPGVLPGTYTIRLSYQDQTASLPVNVIFDPRKQISRADLEARNALIEEYLAVAGAAAEALQRLEDSGIAVDEVLKTMQNADDGEALQEQARSVKKRAQELRNRVVGEPVQGIRRDPALLSSRLGRASSYIESSWDAPNRNEKQVMEQVTKGVRAFVQDVNRFLQQDWAKLRDAVGKADLSLLKDYEPVKMP